MVYCLKMVHEGLSLRLIAFGSASARLVLIIRPVKLNFWNTTFTRDFDAKNLIYLSFSCCISNELTFNAGYYCWSNCSTVQVGWWWSEAAFCSNLIDSSVVLGTTTYLAGLLSHIYSIWTRNWLVWELFSGHYLDTDFRSEIHQPFLAFSLQLTILDPFLVFMWAALCLSQHQSFDMLLTFYSPCSLSLISPGCLQTTFTLHGSH